MMLPLVKILQEHLFQKERTLTHPTICKVRDEIELLFGKYWEEPGIDRYIAAMLDPRFKDLNFEPEKFESTKNELQHRMKEDIKNNNYSSKYLSNNDSSTSLLSSLFEDTFHQSCPVKTELKIYFDMPKMVKYDLSDPLYQDQNLLIFWHNNKTSLPLMAYQAQWLLSIPGTSVPSECLFSDSGNIVTEKRNCLHPNTVYDLLFLKENQQCFNPYPDLE